ncbi:transposase and inactivated derivatives, IS5 family [Serpentinimonas maccroryi]|uniref:Transposase and inactivated derivatives, IS5 family n=1 Tax=Serpentinimonas maccroryi TaxID=1458426 RepID=A0A060NKL4_9BURK|nr:transposase and inactivated derivatives, IS5 family [Serpentinimonas maccroryi]
MFACPATDDFFRSRIDHMIDLRHPLAVLSSRMPWQQIEASVAHLFVRKARAGVAMPELDLFGEAPAPQARKNNAGRPRVALRIMIALLYLKHAFNESDEGVVERWGETPTWQFFSGQAYFEHRRPCDASTLVKFRQLLGDEGVEELLAQTVNVAVALKLIQPQELEQVIVDSTVQHKAIAHPTDSKLLETALVKLVEVAKQAGIELKQTYAKEGQALGCKAGRYAHAKQWRRMKHTIKRQRTIVGRLQREVQRKAATTLNAVSSAVQQALQTMLERAAQIVEQSGQKKSKDGKPKLYSLHAPEVSCINKGKSRQPYEFGVKVGIASTAQHNLIVGAKAFHGNPYDGHTLAPQLEQAAILMQDTGSKPSTAVVDLGYRGVDADNPDVRIVHRGKSKRLTQAERELLKRRQAIEPIIGHLKQDHGMGRCHLKGELGDRLHAVLCAAGYNIKWLLRMIAQKGVAFLGSLFLCLRRGSGFAALKRLWGQRRADGLQSGGSWALVDRLEMAGAGE